MMFPKKGTGRKHKRATVPEDAIQLAVDEYLAYRQIDHIRIPDALWRLIHATAHPGVLAQLRKHLGGIADNTLLIPISDKYCLAMPLELKTETGRLHGKQKAKAKRTNWTVARSVDQAVEAIEEFVGAAKDMQKLLLNSLHDTSAGPRQ